MFIKSIILATVILCKVKWFYCEKASVPLQVCKRYLDYKFTYTLNFTVDESKFKDTNFTLNRIRHAFKPDSECNDSNIDVSVNRTIHREKNEVIVRYRAFIGVKNEGRFNSSVLDTGEKIDDCYCELKTGGLRSVPDRESIYALNISGVVFEPKFVVVPLLEERECVYCPPGSEEINGTCECSKGTSLDEKLKTCTNCPKDEYQELTGMFNCTPCQNGSTTLNITGSSNRTACKPIIVVTTPTPTQPPNTTKPSSTCPKGEYLKNDSCEPCPKNTYLDISGNKNTSCTPCPSGLVTSETGAIDIQLCVKGSGDNNALAIALPICLLVVIAIAGICFYFWRKKKKKKQREEMDSFITKFKVVENPRYVTPNNSSDEETDDNQLCTTLGHLAEDVERRNLEIPRDCITMTRVRLGRGNFGEVKQVIVRRSNEQEMLCAAKMARGANSYVSLQDMLDELEIHLKLEANHENVVNLIGVCSGNDGPFYLIMECCDNGSLIEYLRKHKDAHVYVNIENGRALSLEWKLSRMLEICNGMKYLANHKIVHRDLAARNVLLDSNTVAKVSDFGMAKDVYLKSYYRQRREGSFPLRWMAIDAIQTFEFTEKTDVWSFGVLVWEIITDGKLPYYDIIDDQKVAHYILNGKKLKRPEKCPKFLYNIMLKCWSNKSYNRPTFRELHDILGANIDPAKHGNPLKRRLSQNMLNAFSQTKSSLKRKISRKGSTKSKESVDDTGRRRGSRKHSQSSFDRIINDHELQRLQENSNAMNNEGLEEETEAELNFPPLGRDKTNNLGHISSTKPKITNNDACIDLPDNVDLPISTLASEEQKNQGKANSSDVEVSKKVLSDGGNNYVAAGATLNVETKGKNELSTEKRPQAADLTAKYGSYQETTDLDDLADDTSETPDDILKTVADNQPDTLADDRTFSGKLNNNSLPEKELNPNRDSACGKTFDSSTDLMMDMDNNWSDEMGETSTAAQETNTSLQDGIYPERRNTGSSPTNQGEDKADFTENGEENEKGSYDGVDLEKSSDKAESEDGQQKSSDFLSDVLSAVKSFQNDDNDTAQTQNETDKEENPNSSSC